MVSRYMLHVPLLTSKDGCEYVYVCIILTDNYIQSKMMAIALVILTGTN